MHSPGIVLRSLRYGDTQVITDIFTATSGTVSFILRSRGTASVAWQPLSLVDIEWEPRPRLTLQRPRELTLAHAWRTLHFQPAKTAVTLFLGEFLAHALRDEQTNESLYDYITNALTWFDESDRHYVNFHVVFLLHLTRFLGFQPNVDDWTPGSYFDLLSATFTRARPTHVHYLIPDEAALVPKFLRMDIRSMRAVAITRDMRRRALEITTEFYRLHVPEFPELQSLAILSEVFE